MTIKIEAWQSEGVKTDECIDKYEFCCWSGLMRWLSTFTELNKCPACKTGRSFSFKDTGDLEKIKTGGKK